MTTRIDKPLHREVTVWSGSPLPTTPTDYIVTLLPGGLKMRVKGSRKSVVIPWQILYVLIGRYDRTGRIPEGA